MKLRCAYVGIVFTCSTLHMFLYPVPAGDQGSLQHLTLWSVPVDVLANMFTWLSTVKELECHYIHSPQEVQ